MVSSTFARALGLGHEGRVCVHDDDIHDIQYWLKLVSAPMSILSLDNCKKGYLKLS
jgi:hypothetical protein